MTDTTTTAPAAPTAAAAAPPPGPPPTSAAPGVPARSRAWVGVLVALVAVALLGGATAALFVRVEQARDRADEAVVLAGTQDALEARIDELEDRLASLESSGSATADEIDAARDQLRDLRRCVNQALDAWAQATQTGAPAAIAKC